jgi:hypothetical protein
MGCCHGYHAHCYPTHREPYPEPSSRRYDYGRGRYVRALEEERDLLEERLRRLEQELSDLRQSIAPAVQPG